MIRHLVYQALVVLAFVSGAPACKGQGPGREPAALTPAAKLIRTRGLATGNVICELQDRAGNIWFRTGGEGIYRYDGKTFTNFTTQDGLPDNEVRAIIETRSGPVLFGTKRGICSYDGRSVTAYTGHPLLQEPNVTSLLEDRSGTLWVGTLDSGVYRLEGRQLRNFLNSGDGPYNDGRRSQLIIDMLQDKAGNIWFCSWNRGGVWRYDGERFTNFLPDTGQQQTLPFTGAAATQASISDDMVYSVMQDRSGNLWFATRRHGACRYDGKGFTSFREPAGFVSRGVYSIVEDLEGALWLTTNDFGVWRYDGTAFRAYTTRDGLVNNSVFSVLADRSGNLWFGTRAFGLSRFDGKTFTTFSD